ncbi:hypothetical protein GM3708_2042 [Geminocystis sp. NIES-3708]|uniref:hypothetical protein n=1 Tax=Geminocystis sp. NIES-3708 TaxID=1615909 RepID=UPI0005FC4FA4|nr:hypothetical protein [Geminocystis sp. NIES-3708]BAQ61636.1 hypothetical protein GM3708_2042 [Geminocystis sp. NIES-3708]
MLYREKEPVKWINKFQITENTYKQLKELQSTLKKPMAEINREAVTLILEKYSKK